MGTEFSDEESPAEEEQPFRYRIKDRETVVEAILNAVSAVTDSPPVSPEHAVSADRGGKTLPPLYDVIDTDVLTSLSANEDVIWQVSFPYAGREVTVASTEIVLVSE